MSGSSARERAVVDGPTRILRVLLDAHGLTVPTQELRAAADIATLSALRTHLSALRGRLGANADHVECVRGVGYRWRDHDSPSPLADPGDDRAVLDSATCTLDVGEHAVRLTQRQAAVLRVLSQSHQTTVSAHDLQQRIGASSTAAVKIHVSDLRRILQQVMPGAIVGVRGTGGFRYEGPPMRHLSTQAPAPVPTGRPDDRATTRVSGGGLTDPERALLEYLRARPDRPVGYDELMHATGLVSASALQRTVSAVRVALASSDTSITHCGPGTRSYRLQVG